MSQPYPTWDPSRDDEFICTAVRTVAPGVKTVVLAPRRPAAIRFHAGQYVTVEFDVDGTPVNRCYTIASPPTRPNRIALTIKRTGDGRLSRWLHDGGVSPGTRVRVGEPQGDFTFAAHPAPSYLLLTAGTGITPALSMLRELYDLGAAADIVLLHSQGRVSEVPYGTELAFIGQHVPDLQIRFLISSAQEPGNAGGVPVVPGRLTAALLAELVPSAAAREVFICGPDSYRDAARAAALAVGCPRERLHEESFTFDEPDDVISPPAPAALEGDAYRVEFRDHAVIVQCPPGMTLLDAATSAGLDLPSSCTQGLCGTCKSTLVSGKVDMHHAGGIRPREIAAGKVLLCCSRPLTDLVIAS